MNTSHNSPHHIQLLDAKTMVSYLSSLFRTDGNSVEKHLALSQLLNNFKTLNNFEGVPKVGDQVTFDWFVHMLTLRYIADAIEYREDAHDDDLEISSPTIIEDFYGATYPTTIIENGCAVAKVPTFSIPPIQISRMFSENNRNEFGIRTYKRAIIDLVTCIIEDNAESGLTSFQDKLMAELHYEGWNKEDAFEFPHFEIKEDVLDDFDMGGTCDIDDFDVSDNNEDDIDDDDDETEIVCFKRILNSSMDVAVVAVANKFGWNDGAEGEFATLTATEYLVVKAEAGAVDTEEAVELIIETEEDARLAETDRLLANDSRVRDAFLSFFVDLLLHRDLEAGVLYKLSEDRILEITGGNSLPVYAEMHTNIVNCLVTALDISKSNIRLILNSDFVAFTFIDDSSEGVYL